MLLILFPGNCTFLLFYFRNGQKKWISLKRLVHLFFYLRMNVGLSSGLGKWLFRYPVYRSLYHLLDLGCWLSWHWLEKLMAALAWRACWLSLVCPSHYPLLLYLTFLCVPGGWRKLRQPGSIALWFPTGFCQWGTPKELSVAGIYSSSLLHVGSLQVSCIPWPKVTALVGYSWVSCNLYIPFVPSCPTVTSTLALCFLTHPQLSKVPLLHSSQNTQFETAICFLLGP